MVQEGVAARAQHHVDIGLADEAGQHPRLVHAHADRAYHALRAQLRQSGKALAERLLGVVVGVVEVDDVHAVQAEPAEAGVQAPSYAVGAEVPYAAVRGGHREAVGQVVAARVHGLQEAAHLRRDGVLGAGPVAQGRAQAPFGEAETVVRGGVEVADAARPGGVDRVVRLLVGDLGVQVADAGGAEGQRADGDAVGAEGVHRTAWRGRRPCIPPSTASAVPVVEPDSGLAK